MKNLIIAIIVVIAVVLGGYWLINKASFNDYANENQGDVINNNETPTGGEINSTTTQAVNKSETVIGKSVEGRDIVAYHFGTGAKEILFVGGMHGGYSWNTALVAEETANYLKANPSLVPGTLKVTVIPVLNPDGLNKVVGTSTAKFSVANVSPSSSVQVSGRFNSKNVDLNRNFDCDWQTNGTWQSKTVSGGSAVFSEPESQAVKSYIETIKPVAVVVWYSAAGGVYASSCHNGVLPETTALMNTYAQASGYQAYNTFDFYETTGDMVNWLAKIGVPAISVLLTNHTDTEWSKNRAGVEAVIKYYTK